MNMHFCSCGLAFKFGGLFIEKVFNIFFYYEKTLYNLNR